MRRFRVTAFIQQKMALRTTTHIPEHQLLNYLDGEIQEDEAAACAAHIKACWSCRAHLDEMSATISAVVAFRDRALEPHLPPSPGGRARFMAALRVTQGAGRAERSPGSWFGESWWRPLPVRIILPVALVGLVALVSLWKSTAVPLSASELLRNADERLAQLVTPGTVLYRRWNTTMVTRRPSGLETRREEVLEEWAEGSIPNRLAAVARARDGRVLAATWMRLEGDTHRLFHFNAGLQGIFSPLQPTVTSRGAVYSWPTDLEIDRQIERYTEPERTALRFAYEFEGMEPFVTEPRFRSEVERFALNLSTASVRLPDGQPGIRLDLLIPRAVVLDFGSGRFSAPAGAWHGSYFYDAKSYTLRAAKGELRCADQTRLEYDLRVEEYRAIPASAVGDPFTFVPPEGTPTVRLTAADVLEEFHHALFDASPGKPAGKESRK